MQESIERITARANSANFTGKGYVEIDKPTDDISIENEQNRKDACEKDK